MTWSGTAWAFFPHYILDRFAVSKWAPQYTTEQFVVLLRYNRRCELVPNNYWPKHSSLNIYCPFENVYLHGIWTMTSRIKIPHSTHYRPVLYMKVQYIHTQATSCKQKPKTFSALYYGSIRASRMLDQHSLCSDTEKWYLCNNTIIFVSINKRYFPQIFV